MRVAMVRPTPQVDGLDPERLEATMDAMDANASMADFTYRARNSWVDGARTRTMLGDYEGMGGSHLRPRPFVLLSDEPDALLGQDRGASPTEHALHALAACLTRTLVYLAAARGIELHEVNTSVEGTFDTRRLFGVGGTDASGVRELRVGFDVKGHATPEDLAELTRLAPRHSPMYGLFVNPTEVTITAKRATGAPAS